MQTVHLVTSTYKDRHELDWWLPNVLQNYNLEGYKLDYTIYEKVDGFEFNQFQIKNEHEVALCNFGRCDYAFLFHIVENYEKLADFTVFTKCNLQREQIRILDVVSNCHLYDFCESGGLNKHQFHNPLKISDIALHPSHLIECCYLPGSHVYEAQVTRDWIHEIFCDDLPGHYEGFTFGPCFSVSKEVILRHPKYVYDFLLHKFHTGSHSWNIQKASELLGDRQLDDVGRHFHDCFIRFWKPFFLHGIENPKIGRYATGG